MANYTKYCRLIKDWLNPALKPEPPAAATKATPLEFNYNSNHIEATPLLMVKNY